MFNIQNDVYNMADSNKNFMVLTKNIPSSMFRVDALSRQYGQKFVLRVFLDHRLRMSDVQNSKKCTAIWLT